MLASDLMRIMWDHENVMFRERIIQEEVKRIQNLILESAKHGKTGLMIPPSEYTAAIKSRLKELFPDSKFEDRPMGTLGISWKCELPQASPKPPKPVTPTSGCFRCGRTSHWVQDCFASTDVHGNELD